MVERAADQHLGGYRELASKCAALEERAQKAEAEAARLQAATGGMVVSRRTGETMSVRDEIVERLYERCQHSKASVGGSVRVLRCSACDAIADALLPIVERVAREVLNDAITAATFDGLGSVDADAIVRRVMGDE